MKKLNITFCSFPDYASNAKALYEYMKERYKDSMNYTWIVYNESSVSLLKDKGINAILIGSDEFKNYIPTTDVFFTTQGNLDGDKLKAKKSIYIELWHGIGPKPVGFSQDNPSKEDIRGYSNIKEIVDYFIVPSEFWRLIFSSKFTVEYRRIKNLGFPLLDYFINCDGIRNLSKILKFDVTKFNKVIMFMPTFKKGFNHADVTQTSNNIFNFKQEYDEKILNDFFKKNNYLLCIKKHPGEQANMSFKETDYIKNISEEELINNQISVNEIMNAFDLLITDYSSVGTEFLFLNRPVLFVVGDKEEYIKNRGILFGNLDFWTPGPCCEDISDLLNEIDKLLTDITYYQKERDEKRKLWFQDRKDGGCREICDFLFEGSHLRKSLKRYNSEIINLRRENENFSNIVKEQENTIKKLTESDIELQAIRASKSWQLLEKLRKIKNHKR